MLELLVGEQQPGAVTTSQSCDCWNKTTNCLISENDKQDGVINRRALEMLVDIFKLNRPWPAVSCLCAKLG